jgi:general stress protein CsbA
MKLTQQDYLKHCNLYLSLSCLTFLLPVLFAFYMNNIQILILSSILCICSTLRWKYTTNSFLRMIDVTLSDLFS